MSSQSLNQLPDATCGTGTDSVPVFNCIVILSRDPATARLMGRIANLADIFADGNAERELLMALTKRFKATVQDCVQNQRAIPWIEPPEQPAPGEMQRFIPIHL